MSETPLKLNFFEKKIKLLYYSLIRFLSPFLIILSPQLLSWLTHFNMRIRRLPSLKDRIEKKKNPLDEFVFYSEKYQQFEQVNIVMRGKYSKNINTNFPTFFINTYKPQKNFQNRIYATSDRLMFKAMMGEPENKFVARFDYKDSKKIFYYFMPLNPLLQSKGLNKPSLERNYVLQRIKSIKKTLNYKMNYNLSVCSHMFKGYNVQIGSGILAVVSLLYLSKKVNVYGWDSFLEEKLPKSYYKQALKLWSNFSEFHPFSRFSAIVLNWIYAHRIINYFSSSGRLFIDGKIVEVSKLKWVEKFLYKVIYK